MAGRVVIRRRHGDLRTGFQRYSVFVDGTKVASIPVGATWVGELPDGPHDLAVKCGVGPWSRSRRVHVTVAPGDNLRLVCGATRWQALMRGDFWRTVELRVDTEHRG